MRKKSELFFSLLLLPIDFLAIMAAYVLAFIIRVKLDGHAVPYPVSGLLFVKVFLLIVPAWILIFALAGLYRGAGYRSRLDEIGKVFVGVSGGTMFMILVDFVSRYPLFPAKAIAIYGYGLSFALVVAGRQIVRLIQRFLYRFGIGRHRAVIIGSGQIAARIAEDLQSSKAYQLLGAIDTAANARRRLPGVAIFKSLDQLLATVRARDIDEIIQADSALEPDEVLAMVDFAATNHIIFKFVPNQFGIYATNTEIGNLAGLPVVEIKPTPLDGWGRIVKRVFDLLGAGLGIIVLSPLYLLTGLAIKLTDPAGPVFYRQQRLSRQGQKINLYKFRSMYAKYSPGIGVKSNREAFSKLGRPELYNEFKKENKLANDPRVTPVGKFLRRTSLDELPQLFNVLIGDLSLVGPRPMLESELDRFGNHLSKLLSLRCGLTGLWQVSGRTDVGFEGRIKFDLYYVENWSLWLDIKILIKTLLIVLQGKGAY